MKIPKKIIVRRSVNETSASEKNVLKRKAKNERRRKMKVDVSENQYGKGKYHSSKIPIMKGSKSLADGLFTRENRFFLRLFPF